MKVNHRFKYMLAVLWMSVDKKFIFNKYKIDSITYHQNQRYYASKVDKYKRMHKKVLERLEQVKSQTNDTFENKEKK